MKAKTTPSGGKPLAIKRGNITVKIYTRQNIVSGVFYPQFTLAYYSGNQRVRRNFASLEDAKTEAELVATKLANGQNEVLKLTSADRAIYVQALDLLKPLNLPLNVAVNDYVSAAKRLPPSTNLKEAVDFFLRRNPSSLPQKSVSEVALELIAAKTQAGRSELHVNDLESRLNRFADAMQMNISQVTGPMIQTYLDSLKLTGRTLRNHLRIITSLFRFAVRRKYIAKDALDELESVEKPEALPTETLIFTPAELREMLFTAPDDLIPHLVLGMFCGLRSAELMRLDWAQVNLERRFVEVKATFISDDGSVRRNAKTASRRLVPLCEAAVAWLTEHKAKSGRVAHYSEENKFCQAIVDAVNDSRKSGQKFAWKKNAMRHSFCSYRLAVTHDAAKVALEAGNSPAMIFRHYRELVSDAEGKEWFEIMPKVQPNIVPMTAAAA